MRKHPLMRILSLIVLLSLMATVVACQAKPKPVSFDRVLTISENPSEEGEIAPGLYCLVATEGVGLFNLTEGPINREIPIRSQSFSTRAWVEVRDGETLKFNNSGIETYEQRQQYGCFPSRLHNGFFLVGMDVFPGMITIRTLDAEEGETKLFEIYHDAHDLSEGPVERHVLEDSWIDVEVKEGEFLHLQNTEIYVPPS